MENCGMGRLLGICISEKRGTQKTRVVRALLKENYGIVGDAHAGSWHRQVSLLPYEKIEEFRKRGAKVDFGAFGENLIIEGVNLSSLPVGSKVQIGEAQLEITQIGKECHTHCAIFREMGDCIMPREGVFGKVTMEGEIQTGDEIEVTPPDKNRPFTAAVITLSDRGSRGEREDKSGPLLARILKENNYVVLETLLLPDEQKLLEKELIQLSDQRQPDVIFTTGGTGFSPRDTTPEATLSVCDRMAPGISEGLRAYSMTKTKKAMLSRAVSGIRGQTLIINLPGSPKAVRESLKFLLPDLSHGLGILRGTETD